MHNMQKKMLAITVSIGVFATVAAWAQGQTSGTFSLADAITTAIQNNPSQQANRLIVESAHDEARANRLNSFRPYLRFNVGATRNGVGPTTSPEGFYQSSGISAGMTVYDGGARRSRANAMDLNVEAMEASFNSTNALIPDTSGALAREVFEYYYGISRTQANINFYKDALKMLSAVKPYVKDSDALLKLNNSESNYKNSLDASLSNLINFKTQFEHLLNAPLPDDLENLDQTNERMKKDLAPYSDVEYAISVAKEKNQNYLAKLYSLKAAEENARAKKAELTRPTLDVIVSNNHNKSQYYTDNLDSDTSQNGYVGVQLNYSIRAGIKSSLSASEKKVIAAQQQTENEIRDFVFNIKINFEKIKSSDAGLESTKSIIIRLEDQLNQFIVENAVPGNVISLDDYNLFQDLLANLNSNVMSYNGQMYETLSQRYTLQKEIGILFETAQLNSLQP